MEELNVLAGKAKLDLGVLNKLHHFGMLDLVSMLESKDRQQLQKLLDATYPDQKPSHDARGIYRLAVMLASDDLSLHALLKPLTIAKSKAEEFDEMSEETRELLRKRRPQTYNRLKKESDKLKKAKPLPSNLLECIRELTSEQISNIISELTEFLPPIQTQIIVATYFDCLPQADITKRIGQPNEFIARGRQDAIYRLRDYSSIIEAVFGGNSELFRSPDTCKSRIPKSYNYPQSKSPTARKPATPPQTPSKPITSQT